MISARNVILQYTVATLLVVSVVSYGLAATLTRRNTDHLIRTHIQQYPVIVDLASRHNPAILSFFQSPAGSPLPDEIASLFRDILQVGAIIRIKAWNVEGTVLWSDDPELIGGSFPTNPLLQQALKGLPDYEISVPEKEENLSELGLGTLLEIYIPLRRDGSVAGVLELYESDVDLHDYIRRSSVFIWVVTGAAGALLYGLLFAVFLGSYRRQKRTAEQLTQTQDVTLLALAHQAELRDQDTGRHIERTAMYVRLLAEALATRPAYRGYLTREYIVDLVKSTPLHDVGKVGVPDAILRKPGKLTAEEFEQMKRHCVYGAAVLQRAEQQLSFQSFLRIAIQLCLGHHERWDGGGYPQRLHGDQIPLSARIMAVADVYDALRSARPYKQALTHEECCDIMRAEGGRHFDPTVLECFFERHDEFRSVSEALSDATTPGTAPHSATPLAAVEPRGAP